MSSTTFYVLLVVGALAIAPLAYIVPGRHRGSIFGTVLTAVIFAVIAGACASSWFDARNVAGLLAALALTPLYVVVVNRFGSGGGHPSSSSGDWGNSGGDGGGDGGGGGD